MSKIYKIPVYWEEYGFIEVEANSKEEAITIFNKNKNNYKLPEGSYVEDSFNRDKEGMVR